MHFLDPIHKTGLMCQRWRKNKLQGYYRSFILIFLYLLQGYVMLDSWILLALLCVYFHNKYSSKNGKVIIEVKDTTTKLYYCLLLVVQPQKKQLQGVPTSLEYTHAIKASFTKKMYFAPKNCFFSLFCQLQKWNWILKQLFPNFKQFTK